LGLTCPCAWQDPSTTWHWGWLALALGVSPACGPTWGHLALGLPALSLSQTRAPRGDT